MLLDPFDAAAHRILSAMPDHALIDLRTGEAATGYPETFHGKRTADNAWLVVRPLACEGDRPLRDRAVCEVREVLVVRAVRVAQLDVFVGDRRATLNTDGKGGLTVGTMSVSARAISYDGGTVRGADDAVRAVLSGLRLDMGHVWGPLECTRCGVFKDGPAAALECPGYNPAG